MNPDCQFSWEDKGEHLHFCVLPDAHTGEHVCSCGERHETGHEVE